MAKQTKTPPISIIENQAEFIEWLRSKTSTPPGNMVTFAASHNVAVSQISRVLSGIRPPSVEFVAACGWAIVARPPAKSGDE